MSYDAILQVGKVEETACTILLNAQSEARDRVAAAHSAAEEQLASVKKQLASENAAALTSEQEKNNAYTAQQLAASEQDCERLRQQAASHMDAAVASIMERVMG